MNHNISEQHFLVSHYNELINDEFINKIIEFNNSIRRHKRNDEIMVNGCSSHETGLALAYYSIVIKNYFKIVFPN